MKSKGTKYINVFQQFRPILASCRYVVAIRSQHYGLIRTKFAYITFEFTEKVYFFFASLVTAAQIAGAFFPTYWAMQALHGVVTFGRGLDAIALPSLVLIAYGLLFGWLGSRTMKVSG